MKKQLIWDVLTKLKNKNYQFYGSGSEIRSWMNVNDAAKIVKLSILSKDSSIMTLNAPGQDTLTNKQLIKKIYKICGVSKKPIFNNLIKKGDPKILKYNKSDLKKINWKKYKNFTKGLREYIEWFQKK